MQPSGTHPLVGPPGKILVIDDERLVGRALGAFLGLEHAVTVVHDADDALERLRAGEEYDVILCDVMMPGVSGIDFHRILARERPKDVHRVVFMTGGAYTREAQVFLAGISNDCVDKPPDIPTLRAIIRRHIAEEMATHDLVGGQEG